MYGFVTPINENIILKKTKQEEIIKFALGFYPELDRKYTSPFREDDSLAGCWFEYFNGWLQFIDFVDNPTHRNCFQMVASIYGVDYDKAMEIVYDKFNLGEDVNSPLLSYKKPKNKDKIQFTYKSKPLVIRDKEFWLDKYGITKEQLIEDGTESVLWFKWWSHKKRCEIVVRPQDECYVINVNDHQKFYRPNHYVKWLTNCDKNDIGGLDSLPEYVDELIITKSYKDWRVLKNLGYDTVWFQSEKMIPDNELLISLAARTDHITIFYDNDDAGIKGAYKLKETISQFKDIATVFMLPIGEPKDASDYLVKYGSEQLKKQIDGKCTKYSTSILEEISSASSQ